MSTFVKNMCFFFKFGQNVAPIAAHAMAIHHAADFFVLSFIRFSGGELRFSPVSDSRLKGEQSLCDGERRVGSPFLPPETCWELWATC